MAEAVVPVPKRIKRTLEQDEEYKVIYAIYGRDIRFRKINPTTFQYKFGNEGCQKRFLLEIVWTQSYPSVPPLFNLDSFYNKHLSKTAKKDILTQISEQSKEFIGDIWGEYETCAIIEWIRKEFDRLVVLDVLVTEDEPYQEFDAPTEENAEDEEEKDESKEEEAEADGGESPTKAKKAKKEHLTKSQKRKEWDRMDKGEAEATRGTDWVDVLKHLSQGGSQPPTD